MLRLVAYRVGLSATCQLSGSVQKLESIRAHRELSRRLLNHNSVTETVIGDDIALVLNRVLNENEALERIPAYLFDIVFHDGSRIGQIDLRLGETQTLVLYGGQVGYGIDRIHRGHGYAAAACELLREIALDVGFRELWITCNPDNQASVKTCERIGAQFVEQVDVPESCELYGRGDRVKLRFLWKLR